MTNRIAPLSIKAVLSAFFLIFILKINAQIVENQRFIEVIGTAERSLTPTEFYFQITISRDDSEAEDYTIGDSPEKMKQARRALEIKRADRRRQILDMLWKEGLKETDLVANKYAVEDEASNDNLTVKFMDLKKLEVVVARLRASKICTAHILRSSNPNMGKIKTELRLEAFRNAQAEAQKLAETAGLRLGKVLQINRSETPSNDMSLNSLLQIYGRNASADQADNTEIKLTESLVVRFSIE